MRDDAPLEAAVQSYFLSKRRISEATRTWYANYLRGFIAFLRTNLGREPLIADVDPALANAYLESVGSTPTWKNPKGSAQSERAATITLKCFGSWLAKQEIKSNRFGGSVLADVEQVKVADDARHALSGEDKENLLRAAGMPGDMTYALLVFMLGTGLRLNEARALTVADLDFEHSTVTVRSETSKSGKGRIVFMHREIARQLDRYLRDREDDWRSDPRKAALFVNRSGEPFTIDSFGKVFMRLKEASGVEQFSAHWARHTWATDYMRAPLADSLELKRQGGWEKWEMVERYSHAKPPRDRDSLPNPLAFDRTKPYSVKLPSRAKLRIA